MPIPIAEVRIRRRFGVSSAIAPEPLPAPHRSRLLLEVGHNLLAAQREHLQEERCRLRLVAAENGRAVRTEQ
jgi:hypothetical protein